MAGSDMFFAAVDGGDMTLVRSIINDEPHLVNARDERDWTPVLVAVKNENPPVVEFLLSHGADVNACDEHGFTVLHLVKSAAMVDLLIYRGADINRPNKYGLTPLHIAVIDGLEEVVTCLLKRGAETNVADRKGNTPLFLSVKYSLPAIERLLRDAGARE